MRLSELTMTLVHVRAMCIWKFHASHSARSRLQIQPGPPKAQNSGQAPDPARRAPQQKQIRLGDPQKLPESLQIQPGYEVCSKNLRSLQTAEDACQTKYHKTNGTSSNLQASPVITFQQPKPKRNKLPASPPSFLRSCQER